MDYFRKFFLKILLSHLLLRLLSNCIPIFGSSILFVTAHSQHGQNEVEPQFLAPLENITAVQGRDVVFTCVADNLGEYRVAWIKSDSKAILAIHTHMVALNSRLSVTHNGHNTWKLHISHVQLNDSGSYMCQINTDPMRSQSGYLDVVVPPDILSGSQGTATISDEGSIPENGTVKLSCVATGVPKPTVQWRREGGRDIILRPEGGSRDNKQVLKYVDGMNLTLHHVSRADMGPYMCIASNRVPPSVSKRFAVKVNFMPSIRAVSQLVGAPIHSQVILRCIVEAYPQPLMGWAMATNEGHKLHNSEKYQMTEHMINSYTWSMNLTIRNLQMGDFRAYLCTSDNGLGSDEARVRLQELRLPPTSTTTTIPYIPSTQKPRRKQQPQNTKNNIPDLTKPIFVSNPYLVDDDLVNPAVETPTQPPSRINLDSKMRNTQIPAAVPTHKTYWSEGASSANCNSGQQHLFLVFAALFMSSIMIWRQVGGNDV